MIALCNSKVVKSTDMNVLWTIHTAILTFKGNRRKFWPDIDGDNNTLGAWAASFVPPE